MSSLFQIAGRQGKFVIIARGSKNVRIQNVETKESFLVEPSELQPLNDEARR